MSYPGQPVYHGQDAAYPPPAYPPPSGPPPPPPPPPPAYQATPPAYPAYNTVVNIQPRAIETSEMLEDGVVPNFEMLSRGDSVDMQCPHCKKRIETLMYYKIGCNAVLTFFLCLLFGFFFFGCVLACTGTGTKDVIHACPKCLKEIGRDKRLCGRKSN
ncbi:cell death-inducing p53-target protein 1-like [Lineus longissimus]|uniref:cell death-inducing p53-target protein 1-like n=1 Tax=Lineus longissimus TaxID=88925 RepID=UPI002B4CBDEF